MNPVPIIFFFFFGGGAIPSRITVVEAGGQFHAVTTEAIGAYQVITVEAAGRQ